jgi:hypothetical protein
MRHLSTFAITVVSSLVAIAGCAKKGSSTGGAGAATSSGATTASSGSGRSATGSTASAGSGGATASAGSGGSTPTTTTVSGSSGSGGSGAGAVANGNPDGSCSTGIPAEGMPVDTSKPTTVVGTGTAASCTFAALDAAVTKGGVITFDCGSDPVTISVTSTLVPPTSNAYANQKPLDIVIDGGGKITLDGGDAVQILSWVHAGSWQKNTDTLTLQHLRFVHGKTTPTEKIPACPPANGISNATCSTGYDDGQGGAINTRDGSLRVIDCYFGNNQAALLGPDTGGGAIYMQGALLPAYIVKSTFEGNTASNAGAIGMLWAGAFILDSLFDGNTAVGTGANNDQPADCTCMNNGQNQTGSGGNGGAIYKDGADNAALTLCGTQIRNSKANEWGTAVFLTADGSGAKLVFQDSLLVNNTSPAMGWYWCTGVSTDNPYTAGSSTCSPNPVDTKFCTSATDCTTTCTGG